MDLCLHYFSSAWILDDKQKLRNSQTIWTIQITETRTHTPSNAQFCYRVPDIKTKQEMDFSFVMFIRG